MRDLCFNLPRALLCGLVAVSLTSCTVVRSQPPAPVMNFGTRIDALYGGVMARPGDTVWKISQRYNLPVRDIIEINGMSPPYALAEGQRLKLPPPMEHRVGRSDTLNALSRMYDVPQSQLVRVNNLKAPYLLQIGQVLRIPSSVYRQDDAPPAIMAEAPRTAATPASAATVIVRQPSSPLPRAGAATPPAALQQSVQNTAVIARHPVPPALTAPYAPPKAAPPPQTTVLDSRRPDFNWPLRGKIISAYGEKAGGLFNDGINIAAPKGTPVLAAADGVVAYVGSDLSSYGNLVLIRHGGGMVTAYAHLNSAMVRKDAVVRKGQAIGTIGSTGTVSHTQLHFEIRQGTRTFDPAAYLKG